MINPCSFSIHSLCADVFKDTFMQGTVYSADCISKKIKALAVYAVNTLNGMYKDFDDHGKTIKFFNTGAGK